MQILPMSDLKDTAKIENMCVESQAPVFITKNGYAKLVIMDITYFEKLVNQIYEAKIVNKGIARAKANKVKDGKEVLEELKQKMEIIKKMA